MGLHQNVQLQCSNNVFFIYLFQYNMTDYFTTLKQNNLGINRTKEVGKYHQLQKRLIS